MLNIVAIHGINMHRASRTAMAAQWHEAITEGLRNIRSPHADTIDLDCVFYGHEYNDGKGDLDPEYVIDDLEPGLETDLALAIGAELSKDLATEEVTKVYLPELLQRALVAIQASSLFEGRETVLVSFVKQVNRYMKDDEFRAVVHREVQAAVQKSPRVIIGHSLGSIIAYDWLQRNEGVISPALITIGSPLGLEAIRTQLARPLDRSRWPGSASSWTNIAAHHDAVAMVKKLQPLYHPDIDDQPCDNPGISPHSALLYLSNVRTSRAIDRALG